MGQSDCEGLSERKFYQKITDIYATALDYDPSAKATKRFFAAVQNKLHYSVHGQTAAEVIYNRADAKKENMGLTSWDGSPKSKIHPYDVIAAKNYLTDKELSQLERIVSAYLDLAEAQAERHIPMTMANVIEQLNNQRSLSLTIRPSLRSFTANSRSSSRRMRWSILCPSLTFGCLAC